MINLIQSFRQFSQDNERRASKQNTRKRAAESFTAATAFDKISNGYLIQFLTLSRLNSVKIRKRLSYVFPQFQQRISQAQTLLYLQKIKEIEYILQSFCRLRFQAERSVIYILDQTWKQWTFHAVVGTFFWRVQNCFRLHFLFSVVFPLFCMRSGTLKQ